MIRTLSESQWQKLTEIQMRLCQVDPIDKLTKIDLAQTLIMVMLAVDETAKASPSASP